MSALRLARGIVGPDGKIGVIDTEARRSLIYADEFNFDVLHLDPPFRPERYIEAIEAFEAAQYDIIIIDSASHEWSGIGGILEDLDNIPGPNAYVKWKTLTPRHNHFIEKMTRCKSHLIITLRGKDQYVLEENDKGKQAPKKVGMGPIQRDGLEYEFQFALLIDQQSHVATVSKDNTHLFENHWEVLTEKHGAALREWSEKGTAELPPPPAPSSNAHPSVEQHSAAQGQPKPAAALPADDRSAWWNMILEMCQGDEIDAADWLESKTAYTPVDGPNKGKSIPGKRRIQDIKSAKQWEYLRHDIQRAHQKYIQNKPAAVGAGAEQTLPF